MIKKAVGFLLIILVLFVSGCSKIFYEPEIRAGHHISALSLHNDFLYFGAGYCLYELNTQNQNIREILCKDKWLFQRPAVDENQAYMQVKNSITEERFFIAVNLQSGTPAWQVQDKSKDAYFKGIRQDTYLIEDMVVTARGDGIDVFDTQSGKQIWTLKNNHVEVI